MVNLIKDSERGDLMAFDTVDVPFYVKRVFVVNNVPEMTYRGSHCHKLCKQFLICLSGDVHAILYKNALSAERLIMQKGDSVLIDNMIWSEQLYKTKDSSLMVLCSDEYDKNDYITDFEEFKRLTQ